MLVHKMDRYGHGEGTLTYELPQNLPPTEIYSPDEGELLIQEMQKLLPNKSISYYSRILEKYRTLLHDAILIGLARGSNAGLDKNYGHFSYKELRHRAGRYTQNGKQHYWFDFFEQVKPTLVKIKQGYKFGVKPGVLTVSKVNMDPSIKLSTKKYFSQFDPDDIKVSKINMPSLESYIDRTRHKDIPKAQQDLQLEPSIGRREHLKSLIHNLQYAENILLIASEHDGVLPQIKRPSKFGRMYLGGVNLLNASKRVRHAALGDCWAFDIEASAITWKYIMCKSIDPSIKLPETLDYIDNKNRIRNSLCQRIFGNNVQVDIIKQVISAVGFGARTNQDGWIFVGMDQNNQAKFRAKNAITSIIRSKEHRTRLLEDTWFKAFTEEQQAMDQCIVNYYKMQPKFKREPFYVKNRWKPSTLLSCLYQFSERQLLDLLVNQVEKDQEGNVLLTCHDGFYTRYKPNISNLQEILREYWSYEDPKSGNASVQGHLDYEHIPAEYFNLEEEQFLQNHKLHIQAEEIAVAGHFNKPVHKPECIRWPKRRYHEDFDAGHDDGTSAYTETYKEYWDLHDGRDYELEHIMDHAPEEQNKFWSTYATTMKLNSKE